MSRSEHWQSKIGAPEPLSSAWGVSLRINSMIKDSFQFELSNDSKVYSGVQIEEFLKAVKYISQHAAESTELPCNNSVTYP